MASSSKSIRWKDTAEILRNSEQWLKTESELEHSCNIAFRVSGDTSAWKRAKHLTMVAAAALERCPDANGVYWEASRQFLPAATFCQLASDRHVIANIWGCQLCPPGRRKSR